MRHEQKGWIGFDLDGTTAVYNGRIDTIGAPIKPIVQLIKDKIEAGEDVRIFTARVFSNTPDRDRVVLEQIRMIREWCVKHIGQALPITCTKDYLMTELYDDRCWRVEHNTGRIVGKPEESAKAPA